MKIIRIAASEPQMETAIESTEASSGHVGVMDNDEVTGSQNPSPTAPRIIDRKEIRESDLNEFDMTTPSEVIESQMEDGIESIEAGSDNVVVVDTDSDSYEEFLEPELNESGMTSPSEVVESQMETGIESTEAVSDNVVVVDTDSDKEIPESNLKEPEMTTPSETVETPMETAAETPEASPDNVVVVDSAEGDDIITRVSNIPMVSSTIGQMSSIYSWTKDYSSLANTALGYAEKSVAIAAQTAMPVVGRLEKPITLANDFACQQLDKLEEKVPLITKPTGEVVATIQDGTRQVIENTKQKGSDSLNMLMDTRVGKVVSLGVDTALAVSEYAVEYYLPPDETEKVQDIKDDYEKDEVAEKKKVPSSVERVSTLTNKVQRRVMKKALMNIRYAQKRSQETIEKLHFTVDLIDYAKNSIDGANQKISTNAQAANQLIRTNAQAANEVIRTNAEAANQMIRTNAGVANQMIRTNAGAAQEKLWNTWNDWTTVEGGQEKDEDNAEIKEKEGEQKTLAIARELAARLRGLTHNIAVSVAVLPKHIRGRVDETVVLADAVYRSFEEARYFSDIPTSILTKSRVQLNKLSNATSQVVDYIIDSTPLQRLLPEELPNVDMEGVEFDYMPGSDQNDVDLTSESSEA